jgi:hypothetical protein
MTTRLLLKARRPKSNRQLWPDVMQRAASNASEYRQQHAVLSQKFRYLRGYLKRKPPCHKP